jgi:hypothetical protein
VLGYKITGSLLCLAVFETAKEVQVIGHHIILEEFHGIILSLGTLLGKGLLVD